MKKLTYLLPSVLLLISTLSISSCTESKKKQKKIDSLITVNHLMQSQMDETDNIIASVLGTFQEINEVEKNLNSTPVKGETKKGYTQRVENNMRTIAELLQKNKDLIQKLNEKLEKMGNAGKSLSRTVSSLQKQLKDKTKSIKLLSEELKQKNIAIKNLDKQINTLTENVAQLEKLEQEREKELKIQDALLYRVKYCIGTKQDLKEMKILVDGEIATEGYQEDYFTTIDLRKVKTIPLYSKKARFLTQHPTSSYKLVKEKDGNLVLNITNSDSFWEISKVLIVNIY